MDKPVQINVPTILVIFGVTGDLMATKITPALFHLFEVGRLPELFKIIGFSRRDLSIESFKDYIIGVLKQHEDIKDKENKFFDFLQLFFYQRGFFENKNDFLTLAKSLYKIDDRWGARSNKLFYLAVPPQFYENIFRQLSASRLCEACSPEAGWTSILVEKPFGKDLETAQRLDKLLRQLFKEEQIYRIDHYLAKEMLQNILAFRFSNDIFEQAWNNQFIESIYIRLLETIGVENRGSFYDGLGALKDVGQNHLLQMLALVTMDNPGGYDGDAIRLKRTQILETLKKPSQEEIKKSSFRAQYKNYRSIPEVSPDSDTETYFKVKAFVESPRWQGVKIVLESGKRLAYEKKDIMVTFRHLPGCICPKDKHYRNILIFSLEPMPKITVQFWSKRPGLEMKMEERLFDLYQTQKKEIQYIEEYQKLLYDCIIGDQTLFVSTDEIIAMWQYVDPIGRAWQENIVPLEMYEPGTNEILINSKFVEEYPAAKTTFKKEIGVIGLGKMGANIARRLIEKGWLVAGFNRTPQKTRDLEREGLVGTYSLKELVDKLSPPRTIWLMVPSGEAIDEILFGKEGLYDLLAPGDIVVDGSNSFYKDSIKRSKRLADKSIEFLDAGISGGPAGARQGASLMVGGSRKTFEHLLPLFTELAVARGVQFFEDVGAGHFVKMVHNGIGVWYDAGTCRRIHYFKRNRLQA